MARTGRFGRLPRSAPSLTNTIVAIAREMQATRDRNIMDAWKSGGMFEGQPATDEVVLAHWRERLSKVDPKDPLADTYRNTVFQYEYAIAESKIATEYAHGRKSDGQMAQFYLSWANKVPKDSEFWRVLQRDAAQFMRAAQAKGRASAAAAKEEGYQQAQEATYNQYERAGEYATSILRQLARSNALIGADPDSDFTNFDTSDPGKMLRLLETLNGRPWYSLGQGGSDLNVALFRDPITGEAVTAAQVQAKLKEYDPNFDGRVTLDYVRGLVQRQLDGQQQRFERATATGHKSDANAMQKWLELTSEYGREINLWPAQVSYGQARQTFLQTWMSGTTTPEEKLAAWERYATRLSTLAADANLDDYTRSRLVAEVNGDGSVPSLAEDLLGLRSADNTTPTGDFQGDIAETVLDVQRYRAMQEAVASGAAVWTTGITKGGLFVPQPGGPEIGAASIQQVQQASPVSPVLVYVPQGLGVQPIPVAVTGVNVLAEARDETGRNIARTDVNPVAAAYDVTIGGERTRLFSYRAADGRTYYTTDAPWNQQTVRVREDDGGLVVDLSAYVPRKNERGEWVYSNGQIADVSGNGAFGLSEPTREGVQHLVVNPSRATYLSDPARATAGIDPTSDFFSPTLAVLSSSGEGRRTLSRLSEDPTFRQQLMFEAQQAAVDPSTGQVDQALLSRYSHQVTMATLTQSEAADAVSGVVRAAFALFDRATTRSTFEATSKVAPNIAAARGLDLGATVRAPKLPSDESRGTQFAALGEAFESGTSLLRRVADTVGDALQVQFSGTLRVPEPPEAGGPDAAAVTGRHRSTIAIEPPKIETIAPPENFIAPPNANDGVTMRTPTRRALPY